jgi:hypothetical protein
VQKASAILAKRLRNPAFLVPASRLHAFETANTLPSIYRLYALAMVYKSNLSELLSWYGIPLN